MGKVMAVVLVALVIINVILGITFVKRIRATESPVVDSVGERIQVIEVRRDSVRRVVDTIVVRIRENKDDYEKARDAIGANGVDDDYLFFEGYLASRFDSLDND